MVKCPASTAASACRNDAERCDVCVCVFVILFVYVYVWLTGTPWRIGAISTARWEGVYLADVLRYAGIREACKR